jgi:hypothetical protein
MNQIRDLEDYPCFISERFVKEFNRESITSQIRKEIDEVIDQIKENIQLGRNDCDYILRELFLKIICSPNGYYYYNSIFRGLTRHFNEINSLTREYKLKREEKKQIINHEDDSSE